MSSLSLERPCGTAPAVALQRVEAYLLHHGYQVGARSDLERHLLFAAGSAITGPMHLRRHRLLVRCERRLLRFIFEVAAQPGEEEVPIEPAPLEARVDAAVLAAGGTAPVAAGPARCATCGTMGVAGAAACEVCGSSLA